MIYFPIRCSHLSYTYYRWGQQVTAIDDLSLEIRSGEWVMLVGPNGSGKSTLLRLISKRLHGYQGAIYLGDQSIEQMSNRELTHHIFYVHQNPLLGTAPDLTVFENLSIADISARPRVRRQLLEERYAALLEPFGLQKRLRQPVRNLSGGERQLLTLLIVCLRPASTILLDEPTAALDPENARLCMDAMDTLHKAGRTLIQVTHDSTLATSAGNRTVVLRAGTIVYDMNSSERTIEHSRMILT